jgi:hypothetical protein
VPITEKLIGLAEAVFGATNPRTNKRNAAAIAAAVRSLLKGWRMWCLLPLSTTRSP